MNNLRTSPPLSRLSSCKNLPPYFFLVHLLHRLYGVDAPGRCYSRCGLLLSVSGRFVACLSAFCLLSLLLNENCHIVSAMKICCFGFTSAVIRSVVIGLRGSITSVAWSFGLLVTTIQPYKNG